VEVNRITSILRTCLYWAIAIPLWILILGYTPMRKRRQVLNELLDQRPGGIANTKPRAKLAGRADRESNRKNPAENGT